KQVLTNLYYTYNRMTFPEEIYTVMFYGIYNQKDMMFTYSSAGMNIAPLVLRKNGTVDAISIKGLPICRLGGLVSPSYENQTIQLEDGDSVLLYTDGLIEIDRKRPDQFNEKYLMEYLRGLQNFSASDTVDYMIDLYNTILGENKVIDDVTVLVVKIEEENVLEEVV
ncbi:MAG: serine/threonine-protein phosphatase, partial [Clostridiales bacterium]|nr:serine/threonine-protein phosphatase [Clostridiales bacterium]